MNFQSFDPEISSTISGKSKIKQAPVVVQSEVQQIFTQVDINHESASHMLNLHESYKDIDYSSFQEDQKLQQVMKTKKENNIHQLEGKKYYECQYCLGILYHSNQQLGGHTQKSHSKAINKQKRVKQYPLRSSIRLQINKK